jgi:hypothetical protein
LDVLGESFDSNAKVPVAPCFCVPALKINLYVGTPSSAIALAI